MNAPSMLLETMIQLIKDMLVAKLYMDNIVIILTDTERRVGNVRKAMELTS